MSIYVTGDTHIPIDIHKLNSKNFPDQKNMTKNDYMIILGDFGLLWENIMSCTGLYWLKWLNERNFATLFLDGNHENHKKLFSGITAPEIISSDYTDEYIIEKKFGGYVGKVSDSIYHLRRGEVYIINGKKFFTMGGGGSIDKYLRVEGVDWWPEEEPNRKELYYGLDNLEKHNNTVDYILGHTAPKSVIFEHFDKYWECSSAEGFFDHIINFVDFEAFYCGHTHIDNDYGKYHFLYQRVMCLEDGDEI